eukprot:2651501-Pyramimonas_sp.AAC.1
MAISLSIPTAASCTQPKSFKNASQGVEEKEDEEDEGAQPKQTTTTTVAPRRTRRLRRLHTTCRGVSAIQA